ncbi:MAG: fasciclin domain-containing protein [Pontimonas sp.]
MKKSLMAALAAATLVLSGCAAAEEEEVPEMEETVEEMVEETEAVEEEVEPAPEPEVGDIVAVATEAGSFTTLVAAVQAAGLVETLQGEGPFTVFAPTDEAFAALPEGVLDALLLEENLEVLQQILTYHVVSGEVLAADVTTGDVATVEGSTIAIEVGEQVTLNGTATVVTTDVVASNGVIHVIDQVILPEGVDPAALVE